MPYFPPLQEVNTKRLVTDTFSGYNHNLKIGDGEFYDTMNLSTRNFPLFENREKRGLIRHMANPGGMLAKEKLAFADDGKLYYDNAIVYDGLSTGEKQIVSFGAYILVFPDRVYYNTKDPADKGRINFELDENKLFPLNTGEENPVYYYLACDAPEGWWDDAYAEHPAQTEDTFYFFLCFTPNYNALNGLGVDKLLSKFHIGEQFFLPLDKTTDPTESNVFHDYTDDFNPEWLRRNPITLLKKLVNYDFYDNSARYSGSSNSPDYVHCVPSTGLGDWTGHHYPLHRNYVFQYDSAYGSRSYFLPHVANRIYWVEIDGVRQTSGWSYDRYNGKVIFQTAPQTEQDVAVTVTISTEFTAPDSPYTDYLPSAYCAWLCSVPKKTVANPHTYTKLTADCVPEMDFVIECKNRLWGCKYGIVENEAVNEIYGSALGDFQDWKVFEGISTDPYAASVGSDGPWTGAVNYLGYPTFFKENRIYRVAVSSQGAHEIAETVCEGVQKGSHKSLAVLNGLLYYKGPNNVCIYQGGITPESISQKLGDVKYSDATACAEDGNYYLSMKNEKGSYDTFVYDSKHGLWIREDATEFKFFAVQDNEILGIDGENRMLTLNGHRGVLEDIVKWYAETGVMYYEYPDKKYVSRYNIRLDMEGGSRIRVYLDYDSRGIWVKHGEIIAENLRTVTLPIRPRRCDHLRMRIEGMGNVKIYSIARILEIGSDY
mgnify:FL=1